MALLKKYGRKKVMRRVKAAVKRMMIVMIRRVTVIQAKIVVRRAIPHPGRKRHLLKRRCRHRL